jgi:hypothetical protein
MAQLLSLFLKRWRNVTRAVVSSSQFESRHPYVLSSIDPWEDHPNNHHTHLRPGKNRKRRKESTGWPRADREDPRARTSFPRQPKGGPAIGQPHYTVLFHEVEGSRPVLDSCVLRLSSFLGTDIRYIAIASGLVPFVNLRQLVDDGSVWNEEGIPMKTPRRPNPVLQTMPLIDPDLLLPPSRIPRYSRHFPKSFSNLRKGAPYPA